jgi:hypothetical protein
LLNTENENMDVFCESSIDGTFEGFDEDAIFLLRNGQCWKQSEYKYHYHYKYNPPVTIIKKEGKHFIIVAGLDHMIKVERLYDFYESKVDGDSDGWDGNTTLKLINGQTWKQDEYYYKYHYANSPRVIYYKDGHAFKMNIDGINKSVKVKRLK